MTLTPAQWRRLGQVFGTYCDPGDPEDAAIYLALREATARAKPEGAAAASSVETVWGKVPVEPRQ
jgi:hypothetical protein